MVLDLINILGHKTCENKIIGEVKHRNLLRVKRVIGRVKIVNISKPLGRLLKDK